jgi:hypothetical protein
MMDPFVEAQNNLKRMSYAGCVTLFKTRQSHAVRFSFMPMVMKSPGLKLIEAQNARSSSACVPYLASMRQRRSSMTYYPFGEARNDELAGFIQFLIACSRHLLDDGLYVSFINLRSLCNCINLLVLGHRGHDGF